MHISSENVANVVGALVYALGDTVRATIAGVEREQSDPAALVHLLKYPGDRIDALRVPLDLTHAGCVRLVDRLERARLVERRPGADGRSVAVHLTPDGKRQARQALAARVRTLSQALDVLSPAERRELGRLAGKVLERRARSADDALRICRLCDYDVCVQCPMEQALGE